jgi:hypothetical protein
MIIEYQHGKFLDTEKVIDVVWREYDPGTGHSDYVLCVYCCGAPNIEIVHSIWCDAFAIEKKIKQSRKTT